MARSLDALKRDRIVVRTLVITVLNAAIYGIPISVNVLKGSPEKTAANVRYQYTFTVIL